VLLLLLARTHSVVTDLTMIVYMGAFEEEEQEEV